VREHVPIETVYSSACQRTLRARGDASVSSTLCATAWTAVPTWAVAPRTRRTGTTGYRWGRRSREKERLGQIEKLYQVKQKTWDVGTRHPDVCSAGLPDSLQRLVNFLGIRREASLALSPRNPVR
jgi:hypothetical protein